MSKSSGILTAFLAIGVFALVFATPLLAEDVMGGATSEAAAPARAMAKPAPLGTFSARGTGTVTLTDGSCPTLTCNAGDDCTCLQGTVPVNPTGLGKSTLALTLNVDIDSLGNNGSNGLCRLMSGTGVITSAKGDKVNMSITGSLCAEAGVPPAGFDGTFSISGGTGKLSNARGTGAIDFDFYTLLFSTTSVDLVMNGAFAKK